METYDNYAVKVVKISYKGKYSSESSTAMPKNYEDIIFTFIQACQEACLLAKFQHPNIVKVYETWIQMGEELSGSQEEAVSSESEALDNIQVILNFLRESGELNGGAQTLPEGVQKALEQTQGV